MTTGTGEVSIDLRRWPIGLRRLPIESRRAHRLAQAGSPIPCSAAEGFLEVDARRSRDAIPPRVLITDGHAPGLDDGPAYPARPRVAGADRPRGGLRVRCAPLARVPMGHRCRRVSATPP